MEKKINIAELLKDCPKGMELDCTIFDTKVTYQGLNERLPSLPIVVQTEHGFEFELTQYGQTHNIVGSKCVIFPKGKTTWEGFVPPCKFKDGDVVACDNPFRNILQLFIFKDKKEDEICCNCYLILDGDKLCLKEGKYYVTRLATEEEKQKLFQAIKDKGYNWNAETKTLKELVKPIFKRGDKVRSKNKRDEHFYILSVDEDSYMIDVKGFCIRFEDQDNFELASAKFDINTLKPFKSEVLIRDTNRQAWTGAFYSHYDVKDDYPYHCINFGRYKQCIPYEGNEHLLGKTNDCNDYYKTWK